LLTSAKCSFVAISSKYQFLRASNSYEFKSRHHQRCCRRFNSRSEPWRTSPRRSYEKVMLSLSAWTQSEAKLFQKLFYNRTDGLIIIFHQIYVRISFPSFVSSPCRTLRKILYRGSGGYPDKRVSEMENL